MNADRGGKNWVGGATGVLAALIRQGLIQLAMATGGVLIVRTLATDAYAHYAIALGIVTAATAISNSGIIDGLTALAGRQIATETELQPIVAAALALRRRLLGIVAAVLTPIAAVLLWHDGAAPSELAALIVIAAATNAVELHFAIAMIVPWLRGFGGRVQDAEFGGALVRLLLIVAVLPALPLAPAALLCGSLGMAMQLYLLHRWRLTIAPAAVADDRARVEIMRIVRRQWPNELNTLIQSQAGLWLLTVFADARQVALYAALGRVGILFAMILGALHRTIGARYAVAQERGAVAGWYAGAVALYAVIGAMLWLAIAAFPGPILWLLGPRYAGETALLDLAALAALTGALATLTLWLNAMRGWIMPAWIGVPFQALSLALLTAGSGARSAAAVLAIAIGMGLAQSAINLGYFRLKLSELPAVTASAS